MEFNENSKISELISNEAAKSVMNKHFSGLMLNPRFSMAKALTLKELAAYPRAHISGEQLKACCEDLEKIHQ
ncbi:MAG TPA: hypothetical protein GXX75_16555 [Clostridiales bacterium]|nr:hypothetical protein [Clostridiales bacterium]